jgi:hypothetical protein
MSYTPVIRVCTESSRRPTVRIFAFPFLRFVGGADVFSVFLFGFQYLFLTSALWDDNSFVYLVDVCHELLRRSYSYVPRRLHICRLCACVCVYVYIHLCVQINCYVQVKFSALHNELRGARTRRLITAFTRARPPAPIAC